MASIPRRTPAYPFLRPVGIMLILVLLLLAAARATSLARSSPLQPTDHGAPFLTSNGILLQAGNPLPIFQFTAPQIDNATTQSLAGRFEAIVGEKGVLEDRYLRNVRYTVANTDTNSVLEQYGASGGFYAYNATEAFSDTPRDNAFIDAGEAQLLACNFLLTNELLPANVLTPDTQNCDFDPSESSPYEVTLAHAIGEGPSGEIVGEKGILAARVLVPMAINTGRFSQIPSVPMAGAGGHISLLFRSTSPDDTGFSLDSEVPGLSAVAMPFHDRNFDHLRNAPAVDAGAVTEQVEAAVRASYPTATAISVTVPSLVYMVEDAAEVQRGFEPMLKFEGVSVEVDGETIFLRDISVPAVESGEGGFGARVSILAPTNAATFVPGENVTLTGLIVDGAAPYSYTWALDDGTVLYTGTLATDGTVGRVTDDLPVLSHDGLPMATVVNLEVEDSEGAVRSASVALQPTVAPSLYLPNTSRRMEVTGATQSTPMVVAAPSAPTANYSFGVEAGFDYPPYGPGGADLPGVVPDATGFRSGMLGLGWDQRFYWANGSAWERDWRDCALGGSDCTYGVDRADFAYYAGHGSNGGLAMPSNVNSTWADGSDMRFQRVRWAGFASCLTLRAQWSPAADAPIRRFFNSFQGSHMLLGFNSLMADVAFGPRLVDNMRIPTFFFGLIEMPWAQRTIRDAWVQTAFQMNAGSPAYIYAVGTNGVNPANNKLPKANDPLLPRPYPVASYHWVWWDE